MEYGNAAVEVDHATGKPVNKFDCRYEGEWVVGKTRARGLHSNLSHRRDDRAAASVVTGLSYTTNGKSKAYVKMMISEMNPSEYDSTVLDTDFSTCLTYVQ